MILFQGQLKEYQHDAEEARQAKEDMANSLREIEKRCRSTDAEVSNLQEQLEQTTLMRRKAETERDELYDQLHGSNAKG